MECRMLERAKRTSSTFPWRSGWMLKAMTKPFSTPTEMAAKLSTPSCSSMTGSTPLVCEVHEDDAGPQEGLDGRIAHGDR